MTITPDPYEVLGVASDATTKQIKDAYRRALRSAHPDQGGSVEDSQRVNAAYATLSDPSSRTAYDRTSAEPEHDRPMEPETPEEPWGVQETVTTPPIVPAPGARKARGTRAPNPLTRGAFWPAWRVLTVSGLLIGSVTIWTTGLMVHSLGTWVLLAATPLRVFRKRGWFSLFVELCVVVHVMGQVSVGSKPYGSLLFTVAMLAAGEIARPAVQQRSRSALAQQWSAFEAAGRARGRVYRIINVQPHGSRTTALLFDRQSGENLTRSLWGRWAPGVWVVVDRAGAVVTHCSDDARQAWVASKGADV